MPGFPRAEARRRPPRAPLSHKLMLAFLVVACVVLAAMATGTWLP